MKYYTLNGEVKCGETLPEGATELSKVAAIGLAQNTPKMIAQRILTDSDKDAFRVLEDILQVLSDKNIMLESDLPQSAQDKIQKRRDARAAL